MTKAQDDFIHRKESGVALVQDGRDFLTWYHPDDIHRIAYAVYEDQPEKSQRFLHAPVMVFGSDYHSFEDKMNFCRSVLEQSEKQILPFVIAPEIGCVHFMAGFIRFNAKQERYELFLFNPTGYTKITATKRLAIKDIEHVSGMSMYVSSATVQTIEKDKVDGKEGPALVSCGPISLMWIEYVLKNPQYALTLNEGFILPEQLTQLESVGKDEYQELVTLQRKAHYELLAKISDEDLERIDNVHYQLIQQFLDYNEDEDAVEEDYLWEEDEQSQGDEWSSDYLLETKLVNNPRQWLQEQNDKEEQEHIKSIKDPENKKIELNLQQEQSQFNMLLEQLKVKTQELINRGNQHGLHIKRCHEAKIAAEKLIATLEQASRQFFENKISIATYHVFNKHCKDAIIEARAEFQNHRGWLHRLHPILKGFIGVLAVLTVIPALIVQCTTQNGYLGTFFSMPKTDASEKLAFFEHNLDSFFTDTFDSLENTMKLG